MLASLIGYSDVEDILRQVLHFLAKISEQSFKKGTLC